MILQSTIVSDELVQSNPQALIHDTNIRVSHKMVLALYHFYLSTLVIFDVFVRKSDQFWIDKVLISGI